MAHSVCPKLNIAKGTLKKSIFELHTEGRVAPGPAPGWGRHLADPPQGWAETAVQVLTAGGSFVRNFSKTSPRCLRNFPSQNRASCKRVVPNGKNSEFVQRARGEALRLHFGTPVRRATGAGETRLHGAPQAQT